MMGGSGKAGDSLVDFMNEGDGDSIGDSDEEGHTGPAGRAAVKLEEKQGAQQTSGAGAQRHNAALANVVPGAASQAIASWSAAKRRGSRGHNSRWAQVETLGCLCLLACCQAGRPR